MAIAVNAYYSILYKKKSDSTQTISFAGSFPFVVPQLGAEIDIIHDGKRVNGKVSELYFKEDTFATDGGFGLRPKVEVFVP